MTALVLGRPHRFATMLVGALAAGLLASVLAVTPVAAADQLRIAVETTYRVDPAKRAVHVILDIRATNDKADTATTYYWYDTATFLIQDEARSVRATSNGSALDVTTKARENSREVTIHYPNLYHAKTRSMRLTFDLPSGKPRSESLIRVGQAHTAFDAWAWGDSGLGDVRIVLPPHFIADVETIPDDADAQLTSSSIDGRTVYTVKDLDDPTTWASLVEASNRDALTDVSIKAGGEPVLIHAWPEDAEWLERVSTVLEASLPDLETAIGLPWPVDGDLEVTEVTSSEIEGYAGFFDSSDDKITISEDLEDVVIVHEASHAWFDGNLFQERWIGEGLADEYAARILAADHPGDEREEPLPVSASDKAAFALNTWSPPNRIDDDSAAYERFGYDASWTVMRAIVDDVTEARMRDVFKAAASRTLTYVGAGPAEAAGFAPDWRRFLDLVTDVGGSKEAEGLLETWVLTPKEKAELTARDAARTRYFALVASGGEWLPGVLIRKPMSNWRFADATAAIDEAQAVLAARDELTAATGEVGLAVPSVLEVEYEAADSTEDLTTLQAEITGWTSAAKAIRAARDELARERSPLVALGLYDTDPRTGYQAALVAFAGGDEAAVQSGVAATIAALAGAEDIGRGRAVMAGAVAGVVLLLLMVLLMVVVLRRRRRPAVVAATTTATEAGFAWASAAPGTTGVLDDPVSPPPTEVRPLDADPPPPTDAPAGLASGEPYATLAATPDLAEGSEAGEPGARGAEPD